VFTKTTAGWKHPAELRALEKSPVISSALRRYLGLDGRSGGSEWIPIRLCWAGIRVHQDGSRVEASGRPRGSNPTARDNFGTSVALSA